MYERARVQPEEVDPVAPGHADGEAADAALVGKGVAGVQNADRAAADLGEALSAVPPVSDLQSRHKAVPAVTGI